MAKRIASIFSIGSNVSDQSQHSNSSRVPSSIHPARPPKEQNSAGAVADPTPELQPTDDLHNLHTHQSAGLTPRLDDEHLMLQSPQLLSPIPIDETSPNGSRRASISSRPHSRLGSGDPNNQPSIHKPLPIGSESPSGNRPVSGGSYGGSNAGSRPDSRSPSRPASPIKSRSQTPTGEQRLGKRRGWLPGKTKGEMPEEEHSVFPSHAWVVTPHEKLPYDTVPLSHFKKVSELWDESGDTFVYLHQREHDRGPSFKVDSSIFSASRKMTLAAHGATHTHHQRESRDSQHRPSVDHAQHLRVNGTLSPPSSQPGSPTQGSSSKGSRSISDFFDDIPVKKDIHLCLPLPLEVDLSCPTAIPTAEDLESLVTMRNVFAFLAGQPLVATPKQSSIFTMFMKIADVLHRFEFSNLDKSSLGEEAAGRFARIVEDYQLADVRSSREKTIEAIVLGERMRSSTLYNEGFVHAVGKYDDISGLKSSKYGLIANVTRKRLERAHLDLFTRVRNIRTRLNDFDFPSLFAGVANSTTSADSKIVHFKEWKLSYLSMRRHVLSFYKKKYGSWPPKARSKKNDFEESGLNRLLLLDVYQDFSDLYDILVDRKAQTTRSVDISSQNGLDDTENPRVRCLRRVLDEYDRSTPPVQPPVPFDIPQLPSLADTGRGYDTLDAGKQKKEKAKKLNDDEISKALTQSYNRDSIKSTLFLEAFMAHERRSARGKSIDEIADLRDGKWLFMYAVLESLPLLVVDAPGLQWTQGVEYFLCQVPKGSAPWVQESPSMRQSWYGVAGGSGMVSLPADIVEHGVEGIYRRSHCWQVAEKWTGFGGGSGLSITSYDPQTYRNAAAAAAAALPSSPGLLSPALTPHSPGDPSRTRSPSPSSTSASAMPLNRRRASSVGGLEQLPLPPGTVLDGSRPVSLHSHDPSKTFGTILGHDVNSSKKK